MADTVGSLAMTASVLLNISPIQDVHDIHRTGSVTERSILPYCMMMIDGANWIMFAILIDDVFPIGLTNAFGCFCGTAYACVYLRNSWGDKRKEVNRRAWKIFLGALCIIFSMATAGVTISLIWGKKMATDRLGYIVDFFTMLLYGSPLALAWKVLRTRCTSGMYLPLTLTIIAASSLWSAYGFLTSDLFVTVPQSVGLLAGLAQLSLFIMFGVADNNTPSQLPSVPDTVVDSECGNSQVRNANAPAKSSNGGKSKLPQTQGDAQAFEGGNDSKDTIRQPLL